MADIDQAPPRIRSHRRGRSRLPERAALVVVVAAALGGLGLVIARASAPRPAEESPVPEHRSVSAAGFLAPSSPTSTARVVAPPPVQRPRTMAWDPDAALPPPASRPVARPRPAWDADAPLPPPEGTGPRLPSLDDPLPPQEPAPAVRGKARVHSRRDLDAPLPPGS